MTPRAWLSVAFIACLLVILTGNSDAVRLGALALALALIVGSV